jgi:TrmH family RNA methyltransferase
MLTNKKKKFIKSLQINKYRHLEQCFLVEGAKNVQELLLSGWEIDALLYSEDFFVQNQHLLARRNDIPLAEQVKEEVLTSLGTLKTNTQALAVVRFKKPPPFTWKKGDWVIGLEDIQDPGNLGTIIRIADWYDIRTIVCSKHAVDFYHPKVIGSSMGSFLRVNVFSMDLLELVKTRELLSYGFTLDGGSIHNEDFMGGGLLLFGNESKGLSGEITDNVTHKLTIPKYGHAESLNVAVSVAVAVENLRRISKE